MEGRGERQRWGQDTKLTDWCLRNQGRGRDDLARNVNNHREGYVYFVLGNRQDVMRRCYCSVGDIRRTITTPNRYLAKTNGLNNLQPGRCLRPAEE